MTERPGDEGGRVRPSETEASAGDRIRPTQPMTRRRPPVPRPRPTFRPAHHTLTDRRSRVQRSTRTPIRPRPRPWAPRARQLRARRRRRRAPASPRPSRHRSGPRSRASAATSQHLQSRRDRTLSRSNCMISVESLYDSSDSVSSSAIASVDFSAVRRGPDGPSNACLASWQALSGELRICAVSGSRAEQKRAS